MKFLRPSGRDIFDLAVAIKSFDGALGSVNHRGNYEPCVDPTYLWMSIPVTKEQMAELWEYAGIDTRSDRAYKQMTQGSDHYVHVSVRKVKRSIFGREIWLGAVSLSFDSLQVPIGSTVGITQSEMWLNVRQFVSLEGRLFDNAVAALEGA